MSTTDLHRPTPEFRDRLEWEVTRTLRRERRLAGHRRARSRARWRVIVALVLAAGLGTTAGIASAQIRDLARRDSLLQSVEAELALASLRLDLVRAELEEVRRRARLGAESRASLAAAEAQHQAMQAEARRLQLNMEEIRAAAQAARDDLNAPLVGGRDFVTERLRLELHAAQQRLLAAEQAQMEAERRARVGAGSELERLGVELDVVRARAEMMLLAEREKLRKEFLERGTAVEELLRGQAEAQLRQEVLVAQRGLEVARARLGILERQRAVGVVGELEVLRAQVDVREREIELRNLARRLRERPGQPPD